MGQVCSQYLLTSCLILIDYRTRSFKKCLATAGSRARARAQAAKSWPGNAGDLRESVVLGCDSSCQSQRSVPWQAIEYKDYLERSSKLIMPGSRVRVPPFPCHLARAGALEPGRRARSRTPLEDAECSPSAARQFISRINLFEDDRQLSPPTKLLDQEAAYVNQSTRLTCETSKA
jgi:hypothetical protein